MNDHNCKNYFTDGGDTLVIGGALKVETGATDGGRSERLRRRRVRQGHGGGSDRGCFRENHRRHADPCGRHVRPHHGHDGGSLRR